MPLESFRSRGNSGTRFAWRKRAPLRLCVSIDGSVYVIGGVFAQSAAATARRRFSRLTTHRDNAVSRPARIIAAFPLSFPLFCSIYIYIYVCVLWRFERSPVRHFRVYRPIVTAKKIADHAQLPASSRRYMVIVSSRTHHDAEWNVHLMILCQYDTKKAIVCSIRIDEGFAFDLAFSFLMI